MVLIDAHIVKSVSYVTTGRTVESTSKLLLATLSSERNLPKNG
jgi:hypothetical protein